MAVSVFFRPQPVSAGQPPGRYAVFARKEVAKASRPTVSDLARKAAVRALERLITLLEDPDASNADVFKAFQLIFERAYPGACETQPGGDFDIIVKEE